MQRTFWAFLLEHWPPGAVKDAAHSPKRLYLFNAPALLEAASGFGRERIVRALVGVEALVKFDQEASGKRWMKKQRTPGGGSSRFYVIDPDLLESEGESQ